MAVAVAVTSLNTKLVAGLHDHIVMRGAAPSLRSLNSLISTSSDCPHARLPPSSPSPLHNKFLIGAPSTINHQPLLQDPNNPRLFILQFYSPCIHGPIGPEYNASFFSSYLLKSVDVELMLQNLAILTIPSIPFVRFIDWKRNQVWSQINSKYTMLWVAEWRACPGQGYSWDLETDS